MLGRGKSTANGMDVRRHVARQYGSIQSQLAVAVDSTSLTGKVYAVEFLFYLSMN